MIKCLITTTHVERTGRPRGGCIRESRDCFLRQFKGKVACDCPGQTISTCSNHPTPPHCHEFLFLPSTCTFQPNKPFDRQFYARSQCHQLVRQRGGYGCTQRHVSTKRLAAFLVD